MADDFEKSMNIEAPDVTHGVLWEFIMLVL